MGSQIKMKSKTKKKMYTLNINFGTMKTVSHTKINKKLTMLSINILLFVSFSDLFFTLKKNNQEMNLINFSRDKLKRQNLHFQRIYLVPIIIGTINQKISIKFVQQIVMVLDHQKRGGFQCNQNLLKHQIVDIG